MEKHQVLVVGAGPGGSTCAFYLAKAGVDVLLVDKESWPRDKPCGDGQAMTVFPVYQDMGIMEDVMAVANPCRGYRWAGDDEIITTMLDKEPWILATPRRQVDDMTRRAALDAGAAWMENYEAVSFIKKKGVVKGVKGYYRGEPMDLYADIVVVACGSHSMLAREMGIYIEDPDYVFYGARGYFDNVEGMDIECIEEHYPAYMAPTGYMWVFPEGGKKANVGVFITEATLKKNDIRLEDYFDWWRDNTKIGKERLGNANLIGEIKGWRLPTSRGLCKNYVAGAIAIGDSANMIDCWVGGGYLLALYAGKFAAEVIPSVLESGDFSEESMKKLHDNMGYIDTSLQMEAGFRDFIFEDPEILKGCLEYIRSIPGYPNVGFQEAAIKTITEYRGVPLDLGDLLNAN